MSGLKTSDGDVGRGKRDLGESFRPRNVKPSDRGGANSSGSSPGGPWRRRARVILPLLVIGLMAFALVEVVIPDSWDPRVVMLSIKALVIVAATAATLTRGRRHRRALLIKAKCPQCGRVSVEAGRNRLRDLPCPDCGLAGVRHSRTEAAL